MRPSDDFLSVKMRSIMGWTSFAPSGLLSGRRGVGLRMCATPSDAPKQKVRIRFLPEDVVVDAEPGECILDVAERGNVDIASSCGVGDCGTCEIEMLPHGVWIRSCVAKVPSHKDEMTFDVVGSDIPAF